MFAPCHVGLKRNLGTLIDGIPPAVRRYIGKQAALAPPLFKTRGFERFCTAMSRADIDARAFIESNLGVAARLRCRVPLRKGQYAFGRPQNSLPERGTILLAGELARDCLHFLDVGANEGIFIFSVFRAIGEAITLHWFEPDSVLARRLTENLQRNSIVACANQVAVADRNCCAMFFRNLSDDSSGSLGNHFEQKHRTEPTAVKAIRLADYITRSKASKALVKVDVEGAGALAWSGLADGYRSVSYLLIEMLAPEIEAQLPARIMRDTGWHAYYIRDFDLIHSKSGEFTYVEPFWNWLFCGLEPSALRHRLSGTRVRVISVV